MKKASPNKGTGFTLNLIYQSVYKLQIIPLTVFHTYIFGLFSVKADCPAIIHYIDTDKFISALYHPVIGSTVRLALLEIDKAILSVLRYTVIAYIWIGLYFTGQFIALFKQQIVIVSNGIYITIISFLYYAESIQFNSHFVGIFI